MGKKFDEEFRQEAVRLVLEGGVPAVRAARDLGVSQTTLSKWLTAGRDRAYCRHLAGPSIPAPQWASMHCGWHLEKNSAARPIRE
jgi:transposase-like protein